jgi:lipopolysaccharide transport system ATP-binding protein
MSTAIKVEGLSKLYRLGEIGTGTISRDIQRWFMRMAGKEDPYLAIGETNDRTVGGGDVVYSLRDMNFGIEGGDVVGIIGRNGAGKSTLLKILSRITSPSQGKVHITGRVASLLEVGTGFHPELTGKENIYLNGAILGMRKREINRKLEEIIDFSGVARYIDTPVRRYSSGMYVRLAFSVAAHLESEILIVDEVLAVGDTEFQKKCMGKMGEVSQGEGKTVLFVSHNIAAIRSLTRNVIYMKNGMMACPIGPTNAMIERYLEDNIKLSFDAGNLKAYRRSERNALAGFTRILVGDGENEFPRLNLMDDIPLRFDVEASQDGLVAIMNLIVKNGEGEVVTLISSYDLARDFRLKPGMNTIQLVIRKNNFTPGKYFATLGLSPANGGLSYDVLMDYPLFEIYNEGRITHWTDRPFGHFISDEHEWSLA